MEEFEGLVIPPMSKINEEAFCSEDFSSDLDIDCDPRWSGDCRSIDCTDCVLSGINYRTRLEFQRKLIKARKSSNQKAEPIKYSFDRPLKESDVNTGVLFVSHTDTEKKHTKCIILNTGRITALSKDGMKAKIKVYGSSDEAEVVSATDVLKTTEDIVDKIHVLTESFGDEFTPHIFSVKFNGSYCSGNTVIKVHEYKEDEFSEYYYYDSDTELMVFSFMNLKANLYEKVSDFLEQITCRYNSFLYGLYSMRFDKWGYCPNCESDDIDWDGLDSDILTGGEGTVLENCLCKKCGCQWDEVYKTTPLERRIINDRGSKE